MGKLLEDIEKVEFTIGTNFTYMKIENEFEIELLIDNQVESKLKVEIN